MANRRGVPKRFREEFLSFSVELQFVRLGVSIHPSKSLENGDRFLTNEACCFVALSHESS